MAIKKKISKSTAKAKSGKVKKSLPKSKNVKSAKKIVPGKKAKVKFGAAKKVVKKNVKIVSRKNIKKVKVGVKKKSSKSSSAKKNQIRKIAKIEKNIKKNSKKIEQKKSVTQKSHKLSKSSYDKPLSSSVASTKNNIKKVSKNPVDEKRNVDTNLRPVDKQENLNVRDELKIGLSQPNQLLIKKPGVILIPSFPQAVQNENKNKNSVEKDKKSKQIANANLKSKKMNSAAMKKPSKIKVDYDKNGKAILPQGYKPSLDEEYMNPLQVEYFKGKLESWKKELLSESNETIEHLQGENWNEPDPSDQATIVEQTGLELRTRDRYRKLINKIDTALRRIEEGEYGYCEVTGDPIGIKRLEARPIATMTLAAQEQHELEEKLAYED